MDANEAIGILRSEIGPSSVLHREIAENMGADALEFQGWLFGEGDNQWIRVEWVMRKWNGEDSFLDFALGEWRVAKGEGMMTTDEQRLFKERAERLEAYRQRIAELEAALAEARKDGERKGIAAWLTDNHTRTREGKLCCVEVRRPDTHGGMACTWKMKDFDIQAEMDGCEVGEEIVLRYAELTDAEFTALGDFDGW